MAPDTGGLVPDPDTFIRKVLRRKKSEKPKFDPEGIPTAADLGLDQIELSPKPDFLKGPGANERGY
jgi:hypothetical protein